VPPVASLVDPAGQLGAAGCAQAFAGRQSALGGIVAQRAAPREVGRAKVATLACLALQQPLAGSVEPQAEPLPAPAEFASAQPVTAELPDAVQRVFRARRAARAWRLQWEPLCEKARFPLRRVAVAWRPDVPAPAAPQLR
jgi:hypothetical protein